jgi:hypothetical protein
MGKAIGFGRALQSDFNFCKKPMMTGHRKFKVKTHWTGSPMPKAGETWQHIYRGPVRILKRISEYDFAIGESKTVAECCLLRQIPGVKR